MAAFVIIADHISKLLIENTLPLNTYWAPIPALTHIFRITHISNTGAAFGMFANSGLILSLIAFVVAGVIIFYNFSLPPGQFWLRLALGLQMGGALGNLIDRIRLGHVTDFLDVGPWWVFNLADLSIVIGVVILAILMFNEQRQEAAAQKRQQQMPASSSPSNDQPPVTSD